MAIIVNNIVQTGPNIQFGGLNGAFSIVVYQPFMAAIVTDEPRKAVKKVIAKEKISFVIVNCITPTRWCRGAWM